MEKEAGTAMDLAMCVRERHWSEIDDVSRIKRTRQEVKCLQRQVQALVRLVGELQEHEHAPQGLMVPLKEEGLYEVYSNRVDDGDAVYF